MPSEYLKYLHSVLHLVYGLSKNFKMDTSSMAVDLVLPQGNRC